MTDYQTLLRKYICHISSCEGIDFLTNHWRQIDRNLFTDEEWKTLETESEEARKLYG